MRFMRMSVVTVVLLMTVYFVWTVYAQAPDDNNGNPTILQAVRDLQNSVNQLTARQQASVRFTPPVFIQTPDQGSCKVVNVTAVTLTVQIQSRDAVGAVLFDTGNISLGSGEVVGSVIPSGGIGPGHVSCKFTVVGGSRTDIRGALAVFQQGASDKLSVPAE
jgi:hypothetical protein